MAETGTNALAVKINTIAKDSFTFFTQGKTSDPFIYLAIGY